MISHLNHSLRSTYDRNPLTNGNIDDSPVDCLLIYLKQTRLRNIMKSFPFHFNRCVSVMLTYDPVKI